jgi:hypothetical protein
MMQLGDSNPMPTKIRAAHAVAVLEDVVQNADSCKIILYTAMTEFALTCKHA